MSYTQTDGYLGYVPYTYGENPIVVSLLQGSTDPTFSTDMAAFCKANTVASIIYTPGTSRTIIRQLKSLHWKTTVIGNNSVMITVPQTVLH